MFTPATSKGGIGTEAVPAPQDPVWDSGLAKIYGHNFGSDKSDPFVEHYSKMLRNDSKKKLKQTGLKRYLLDIGDFHLLNKSFARAESAFREVVQDPKYKIQALRKLITVAAQQADNTKAIGYFDRLIYESDNNITYHTEKINFLLGHYSEQYRTDVTRALKNAFDVSAKEIELYNLSGIFNILKKDLPEAIKNFNQTLKLDPKNIHATNNIGVIYAMQSHLELAEKQYLQALKLQKSYITGYENLAALYVRQNQFKKSLEILSKAKDNNLNLSNEWDHQYGYLLLCNEQLDQAVTWYRHKITQEPGNNLLYNNLGKCYEAKGNLSRALRYYTQASGIASKRIDGGQPYDDRSWLSFYNLMNLHERSGDYQKLATVVSYVQRYRPSDWKVLYYKAQLKIDNYEYDKAIDILQKVLNQQPNFVDAKINLSFLQETIKKDYPAAIDLLEQYTGNGPVLDNNLIFALIKNGELKKAQELLAKYNDSNDYPPLSATRGLLYYNLSKPAKAEAEYKKAIKKLKGNQKKVATQIWLNEKAEYLAGQGERTEALETVNLSLNNFKQGYSYEDALNIKERLLSGL